MAMRFEQLQKQTQKLIMTPQMQQAMYLLQLPLMELNALIQQELVNNPVLEEILDQEKKDTSDTESASDEKLSNEESGEESNTDELAFDEEFAKLSQLDDEWKEHFQQAGTFTKISEDEDKKRRYYESSITLPESLQEHLLKQLRMAAQTPEDMELGELIIGNIDNNGYLSTSLEELAALSGHPLEVLDDTLMQLQTFHPVGVGSRNLSECLLLQLERFDKTDSLEAEIVTKHIKDLGKKNLAVIAKALDKPLADVQKAAEFITTLEPKPGRIFEWEEPVYIVPDVIVEKEGDDYIVMLNNENIPRLRINNLYKKLMKQGKMDPKTKEYIKQKVLAGQWLIKNILQRQQTLFNISTDIVKRQREFLDKGIKSLHPMTMQDIAQSLGIHESTVSRALSHKYIDTPQGLYEVKFFFSGGFTTESGKTVSTTNVKEEIVTLIKEEDANNPLSDQEIIEVLAEKGLKIARRTVAKYRKELNILPSHLRKSF